MEKEEAKPRIDLTKYYPINSTSVIDMIITEMSEQRIYPSEGLKGVILNRISKVKVQKYLVKKFDEIREEIKKAQIEKSIKYSFKKEHEEFKERAEKKKQNQKPQEKGKVAKRMTSNHQKALEEALKPESNSWKSFEPWNWHEAKLIREAHKNEYDSNDPSIVANRFFKK